MGKPEDDHTPAARAAADAELARQDKVAAETLTRSVAILNDIAATWVQQGNGDAAVVLTRAAQQERAEAERHKKQGEHFQEAAVDWGAAAHSLEHQAKEAGQAYVAEAERRDADRVLHQPSLSETAKTDATLAEAAAEARVAAHVNEAILESGNASHESQAAIKAESQAYEIHPEVADDAVAPEPPPSD